ncbi:2-keto-4-pentenoate hydratase/2-oxohepta-3-ene-1,7-dioic acid hydratase in catechol pathway [Actinoplanes campanulatus]|uniref:2-keto-4-pentenoate hydratase/2-oxohepta-3-ene-1,7-dioic acid hydratase in catechol pathway n=1 Tax=Actinoplanes campanulatus TaxID=113559 RepID=A0A7W5AF34_9ACTN|nr:fumarylacetoacetate hydrolase family protein [Actinoplanes campanulatus]MBB3094881.1 2-keto-4-pentenoate hydratase/2-oxohepta-3-ene-1,7-dioic acid hydratase in catechol pathway [Actinoplanes campanulatus]GGN08107.1 2-keto-4-pentenoate hydratase [Actinoplanes campanulatus]GID36175.1 2-keto-4-pentenoate hydratase [Actinoplanes campanulatus]
MRYARISLGGRPVFAEIADGIAHVLDGSPLHGRSKRTADRVPLEGLDLLPPVIPGVFYAVGLNYRDHIDHAKAMGYAVAKLPERPEVGYRANNALTGHNSPIMRPAGVTGRFEAEGEVVAVIGRTLRNATRAEAQESIFGWTIGNDVSAREWQNADRTFWRSKNSDTFKPMGPWIETDVDPLAQTTTVRVDGQVRARFATGAMVFDPYDYIVETTKYITMHPGDVLWMGADSTVQLEPGSTVDIEITGIGVLSNPVQAERHPHE